VLSEHKIKTAGDLERLSDMLESVLHLDLSKNRFDSWKDVIFAEQLPTFCFICA